MEESHNVYLTPDGIKKLQEELDFLLTVRRPEIAQQIADAKSDGDISENAGYDEAKTAQAFVEGRIMTLKNLLGNAVIIHANGSKEIVELGVTVTIRDAESGEEEKIHDRRLHRGRPGQRPDFPALADRPRADGPQDGRGGARADPQRLDPV